MLALSAAVFCSCGAADSDPSGINVTTAASDTLLLTTLTITKVKKPWYAWKALVVKKMKKSIPEYSAIEGLRYKYYSFTSTHDHFGGIYLWASAQNASNWFNAAWYDRTEKKYGKKGIVLSFQIQNINTMAAAPANEGDYCAVLTYPN
ncbi:MAG: hypothetical protein ACKOE6_16865, partial [Flammeovirgaceae bacterium]